MLRIPLGVRDIGRLQTLLKVTDVHCHNLSCAELSGCTTINRWLH